MNFLNHASIAPSCTGSNMQFYVLNEERPYYTFLYAKYTIALYY